MGVSLSMNSTNTVTLAKVQDSLRTKISDFNYRNWFKNLAWEYETPGKVTIRVPSRFVRDWIMDHYAELIKFEFFRSTETEHAITFKVDRHINKTMDLFAEKAAQTEPAKLELASVSAETQAPQVKPKQQASHAKISGFNTKYRFDSYVVGSGNQLVHAASQAVATQPARSYNPLFIYGGVGLGKTHLLNAIGLEAMRQYPNFRIIYVTGERFTNEVINAIRYGKTYELRTKYRDNCDMLLIDDIQFIAGKERTMDEFFHTFNALYEMRKQIVLTSDKMPKDINGLEDRLKSRFGWGLMADIQSPDFETRVAILRKKADDEGVKIPDDALNFIAENVTANVRELEGSLVRLSAFASLAKVPVSLDLAHEVLKSIVVNPRAKLNVESIQSLVAEFYQLKIADLKSKRRHKNLAVPRQIAMYLCKTHLDVSFPELGNRFGGKDHTTVMHAVSKIRGCLVSDTTIEADVGELEKKLGI